MLPNVRGLTVDHWIRAAAIVAMLLAPGASGAAETWRSSLSVTPVWQGNAKLDAGGDFDATGVAIRVGTSKGFGAGHRAGIALNYDYLDYDFSGLTAFGGSPWDDVQRVGFSVPLLFNGAGGWSYGVTPSVEWAGEKGSDSGESMVYGGIASAIREFAPDRRLGFGVGVFSQLEETKVIPLLIVNWRLSERWSLVNPLPAGPVGPAGLELDYRLDNGWRLGLGATSRSLRFRLSDTGPTPGGVGEQQGIPVFLRLSADISDQASLVLYAGAIVEGELRVEDSDGKKLREDSFDPAPLLGATFRMRF